MLPLLMGHPSGTIGTVNLDEFWNAVPLLYTAPKPFVGIKTGKFCHSMTYCQCVTNSMSYGESSDFSEFTFNPVGRGMALKQPQHNVQFSLA